MSTTVTTKQLTAMVDMYARAKTTYDNSRPGKGMTAYAKMELLVERAESLGCLNEFLAALDELLYGDR